MSAEPDGEASLPLVYVADWPARASKALLGLDWSKPRIVALAEALGEGSQELEDVTFDVLLSTRLEAASGSTLDLYGGIVGERRGPLGDEDYRRFIQARILTNITDSTIDEMIAIFALVTYPGEVEYMPMYPAGGTLQVLRQSWLSDRMRRRIRRIMDDAKPAGVAIELIEALPGFFGFEGNEGAMGYDEGVYSRVL